MRPSRLLAAAALALWLLAAPAMAADDGGAYAAAVDRALQILRDPAPGGEAEAARRAADTLDGGVGEGQPEIMADLRSEPPRLGDARARLAELSAAAHAPVFTPEPAKAQRAVADILAQPRYQALRQGPSLLDQARDWLLRRLAELLLPVMGSDRVPPLVVVLAVIVLAVAGVVLGRALRGRGVRREARLRPGGAGGPARRDRFAEADRLAAAGDLTGAIRELAGGVAAALGDERDWDVSPLTVREIFARAPDPTAVRPLLLAFEEAVYGGRPPEPQAYTSARLAAAPFRPPSAERAA